jgi:hypothetical protein
MVEPSGVLIGHIVWPTKAELILARTSNSKSGMQDAGCRMRDAGCGQFHEKIYLFLQKYVKYLNDANKIKIKTPHYIPSKSLFAIQQTKPSSSI